MTSKESIFGSFKRMVFVRHSSVRLAMPVKNFGLSVTS